MDQIENTVQSGGIKCLDVTKVAVGINSDVMDFITIEEPLEIRLIYGSTKDQITKTISITMRTPGDDPELASGFLFTEGIITDEASIKSISHHRYSCAAQKQNIICVELHDGVIPNLGNAERNFYTTSSCGVCGKSSIQSIRTVSRFCDSQAGLSSIDDEILFGLPNKLRVAQKEFTSSGGIHASGLFNSSGDLIVTMEDVGRHNALDKLIGYALANHMLPLHENILLLSGRASFELIQKAAMAGIPVVAAIGAPSSLAVELAEEFGITLIGFLRNDRFNIYTNKNRLTSVYENKN